MTVSEYAEEMLEMKLAPVQKDLLNKMEKLPKSCKVVYGRGGKSYIRVVKERKNE